VQRRVREARGRGAQGRFWSRSQKMNDVAKNLAVQSWCLRAFKSTEQVIEHLKALGLRNIELCREHCNFTDEAGFDDVIGRYRAAGINIVSLGVESFAGDLKKEEKYFKFAQKAGCRHITATFSVDHMPAALHAAEKLAEQYDINIAIHNHGGYDWLGNRKQLAHVFSQSGKRIGLCLDTAWALQAGENPITMAEQYVDRLYAVHLKDFVFDRAGRWLDVVIGEGNLDLAAILQIIKIQAPQDCKAIIEYEGDVENPAPALIRCVAAVRKLA
jgi:sugar phosphate isomerase/epimerase